MICFRMYKKELLFYLGAFLIAVILGMLFELHFFLIISIGIIYMLCVPQLLFNQSKFTYETRRFLDVNAYMSQMVQSFIYTKDIIVSLKETETCFSNGRMRDTLAHALEMIENGKSDIKQAEKDALKYIEGCYSCEKVKKLHHFFMKAEQIGGDCQKEFLVLEKMRKVWESTIESVRVKRFWERNVGAFLYLLFLGVAIIMLRVMRNSDLNIMSLVVTQIIDSILMIGFILYFIFMDNRLNKSLLVDPVYMTEEKAIHYYRYLDTYNVKEEWKKYEKVRILSIVTGILLVYIKSSWLMLMMALGLIFIGCNIHKIIHALAVSSVKREISKALPMWLFDMILLLQRESVEGAFVKSMETAAPILKPELLRLNERLVSSPHNSDAYKSFLKEYGNENIYEVMHQLYSFAVGVNHNDDVLDIIMENNINNLEKVECDTILFRSSIKNYTWIPFICGGFGFLAYLVIAIMSSINQIIQLI